MKKSTYKYATIFTVILCLATLAVAWTSSWFSNWNMADWSKKWETLFGNEQSQPKPTPPGDDTPGGGDTPQTPVDNDVVAISGKGDKMLAGETYDVTNFAYVCAENSVNKTITLNATVTPDNATDKRLEWKIYWTETSGFAEGKKVTDYVTITPSSNTLSCDVNFISDFGTTIQIEVSSISNPAVYKYCTVDCMQKINNITPGIYHHKIEFTTNNKKQLATDTKYGPQRYVFVESSELGIDPVYNQHTDFLTCSSGLCSGSLSGCPYIKSISNVIMFYPEISKYYTVSTPGLDDSDINDEYNINFEIAFSFKPEFISYLESKNISLKNNTYSKGIGYDPSQKQFLTYCDYTYNSLNILTHCFDLSNKELLKSAFTDYSGDMVDISIEFSNNNKTYHYSSTAISTRINPLVFNISIPVGDIELDQGEIVM